MQHLAADIEEHEVPQKVEAVYPLPVHSLPVNPPDQPVVRMDTMIFEGVNNDVY